jgi:Tetratricopeptide repeat
MAFDERVAWAHTMDAAGVLSDHGREFGDNQALQGAIAAYRMVLDLASPEWVPLDWAMTQNNLGNALLTLGQRESGTACLEEAIATWEACLIVVAHVWPPDWVQYVRDHRDEAQSEIKQRSAR